MPFRSRCAIRGNLLTRAKDLLRRGRSLRATASKGGTSVEIAVRRIGVIPALTLAVAAAGAVTPAPPQPVVRAVVSLASGVHEATAPGVRLVVRLGALGEEVVSGTPAALGRLAHDSRVTGLALDRKVATASETYGSGEGVLAS